MPYKDNNEKLNCLFCKNTFSIQKGCLRRRKFRASEPICPQCYSDNINKTGSYSKDYYPLELQGLLKEDVWDYNLVKTFIETLRTHKKVGFICQECDEYSTMMISRMHRRKICGTKPICRKCSLKFAIDSDQWRNANSKAQFIAQNRPEVIEKQRIAQLKLMDSDPLYADKRSTRSFVSGMYKGMRFDSSWELYFIVYCKTSNNIKKIERYDGFIDYYDSKNKKRRYYPDFMVTYSNNKKKVVEIKGCKRYNNFHEKFNVARIKFGANYLVYEEDDLLGLGINFKTESYLRDFYINNSKYIKFNDNQCTRKLKERIKEWLK